MTSDKLKACLACTALALAAAAGMRAAGKFDLNIDTIMRGPGLVGYEPSGIRWSGDSQKIYFQWKQAGDPTLKLPDTYVVGRDGGAPRKLTDAEAKQAPPLGGRIDRERTRTVFSRDGDIFVYNHRSGQIKQLTKTADLETDPGFTADGRHIWFTRAGNLYLFSLEDGSLEELTDIHAAGAQSPAAAPGGRGAGGGPPQAVAARTGDEPQKGTDSQEFLKKQERELLETIEERAKLREEAEARRKQENPRKPLNLEARQSVLSLELAPDGKHVLALVTERAEKAKASIIPNFLTESAYTEDIPSRGMVGDLQSRVKAAILSVATGEVKWVEGPQKDATFSAPVWSEDRTRAVQIARSADFKDRWILALDLETAKPRVIAQDHDDAWVDGPGGATLGWTAGNHTIFFQSERSGYAHLYSVPYEGGEPKALTSGKWEVAGEESFGPGASAPARISRDHTKFFLTTSEAGPGERQFYVMGTDGSERTRITAAAGGHKVTISPDEHWIADVFSYTNKPPELYAQELRPGAQAAKLTASPASDFAEYPWQDAPVVTFAARDGATLHARLYEPQGWRGGPAVLFVHGAGYLENAHRWWSTYTHEYLFHHFLMEHGYVVLDVDYRGSAGYGRDWRTGIYRHMGGKDLDDEVDAARWLVAQHRVDPRRIGLYGGSYGGFITLMAMFKEPDVFAAGAALRPVTDWSHYNHEYTGAILNLPQKDTEAYKQSSPIYFANGLEGSLLICHGMVDTNVHFQDTVRLVQKLIELRKTNWDLAVYPVENHGFVQPTSWADEYKRIFALFERTLKPRVE
ncbi:MAG: prolyl oligopeptidase family serine peptidase [Acidobacteriota bacterium]|nr:prolyl oligopeptidase family serine peptidase [Acidobacteriota bacterium]